VAILRNNQLVETPPPASSPAGAASQGLSPDASKMYGSGAQKASAIKQAITAPIKPDQATQPTQVGTSITDRLNKLGNINNRVDAVVAQRIAAAATKPPSTNLTVDLSGSNLTPQQSAAITDYVYSVNTGASDIDAKRQAMHSSLGNMSAPILKDLGIEEGTQFQAGLNKQTTLGSLVEPGQTISQSIDYPGDDTQLANDLGIDPATLNTMSINDLQQRVRDLTQEKYNQSDALRAEFVNASPARQSEIRNQLAALGDSGQVAVELGAAALAKQIDAADKVVFNGTEMNVGDLLSNDSISSAITSALRDPKAMEALAKNEPALASWVINNKAHLDELVKGMQDSMTSDVKVASDYSDQIKGIDSSLLKSVVGNVDLNNTASLGNAASLISSSNLIQAGALDSNVGVALGELIKDNPSAADQFKNMDPKDIKGLYDEAQLIKSDPDLQQLMPGITGQFLTKEQMAEYAPLKKLYDTLSDVPTMKGNPDFLRKIKDGSLTQKEADWIKDQGDSAGDEFKELLDWETTKKYLAKIHLDAKGNMDKGGKDYVAKYLGFESNAQLENKISELQTRVWFGDKGAQKQIDTLRQDQKNFATMKTSNVDDLDVIKNNKNSEVARKDSFNKTSGQLNGDVVNPASRNLMEFLSSKNSPPLTQAVTNSIKDGKLSPAEWEGFRKYLGGDSEQFLESFRKAGIKTKGLLNSDDISKNESTKAKAAQDKKDKAAADAKAAQDKVSADALAAIRKQQVQDAGGVHDQTQRASGKGKDKSAADLILNAIGG
jgi:hypothetical protein